jgi:Dyp-type peroxidase family
MARKALNTAGGKSPTLERDDIQTLVFSGYPKLPAAAFELMTVTDVGPARRWIRHFLARALTTGDEAPDDLAANLALSAAGLRELGLDEEVLGGFPLAFREGMGSMRGRKVLGDEGENAQGNWEWGGDAGEPHGLLLLYGASDAELERRADELHLMDDGRTGWRFDRLRQPERLVDPASRRAPPRLKEHFGFDDGIANPSIRGEREGARKVNEVSAGEIVLGYPDETGAIPPGPTVSPGAPGGRVLPKGAFGRNGSFLVVRQLSQDPVGFWSFIRGQADSDAEAVRLASAMVGRWPNGAPLTRWSSGEPPEGTARDDDDYLYAGDRQGQGCPIGAHVRRTNPRDTLPLVDDPAESIRSANRRRLLRRGRPYGKPVRGWPDPLAMAAADRDDEPRGLHFLCLCADLDRQFEFVQQSWVNSRKFGGLPNDADPLLSNPKLLDGMGASGFTLQRHAVNRRIEDLPQFVTTRGGAYFFLPGERALRYLSGLRTSP